MTDLVIHLWMTLKEDWNNDGTDERYADSSRELLSCSERIEASNVFADIDKICQYQKLQKKNEIY